MAIEGLHPKVPLAQLKELETAVNSLGNNNKLKWDDNHFTTSKTGKIGKRIFSSTKEEDGRTVQKLTVTLSKVFKYGDSNDKSRARKIYRKFLNSPWGEKVKRKKLKQKDLEGLELRYQQSRTPIQNLEVEIKKLKNNEDFMLTWNPKTERFKSIKQPKNMKENAPIYMGAMEKFFSVTEKLIEKGHVPEVNRIYTMMLGTTWGQEMNKRGFKPYFESLAQKIEDAKPKVDEKQEAKLKELFSTFAKLINEGKLDSAKRAYDDFVKSKVGKTLYLSHKHQSAFKQIEEMLKDAKDDAKQVDSSDSDLEDIELPKPPLPPREGRP